MPLMTSITDSRASADVPYIPNTTVKQGARAIFLTLKNNNKLEGWVTGVSAYATGGSLRVRVCVSK